MGAQVVHISEVKGKTEQRVASVVQVLKETKGPMTYEQLGKATGTAYDVLLYILATLVEVGMVERNEEAGAPGRPKVFFSWVGKGARGPGPRPAA